jgi:hypothetical protein
LHTGHVGDPGRIEDQHFIALIHGGHDSGKKSLFRPWGYDDLRVRVELQAVFLSQLVGYGHPAPSHTGTGYVVGMSFAYGLQNCIHDV